MLKIKSRNIDSNTSLPSVRIGYISKSKTFTVQSLETLCGYLVSREELVGDHRNFGEVLYQILLGCKEHLLIFIDDNAKDEINNIWEINIEIF